MKNMNPKQWKKITLYLVPIVALVIANFIQVEDPAQIEESLFMLITAILGVLGAVGVVSNNDKNDDGKEDA